ncbi:MAG: FkbM family methyltransferase [Chlorobi bacterium]|nr:FkbM family methyltransferase [Chlorobiota bacterium]
MKSLRKIIYTIFGLKGYLKLVSKIYLFFVHNGFLKKKYPELFYLKKIIKPGFYCIDIGANLGYYSTFLAKLVKNNGKVFAVEPVPLFAEIWEKNIHKYGLNNCELLNFALGSENKSVQMGMPEVNGIIHHGMTKIASSDDNKFAKYFDVEMKIPDELFYNLPKVDFIKCDVEGYESEVFKNLAKTIEKFKPVVQSELSGLENRTKVIQFFKGQNYQVKILQNDTLIEATNNIIANSSNDFYFLPA